MSMHPRAKAGLALAGTILVIHVIVFAVFGWKIWLAACAGSYLEKATTIARRRLGELFPMDRPH